MPERIDELFAEYAAAYARGERPAAEDYLARAGKGADELARLMDSVLRSAPAPRADTGTEAHYEAWRAHDSPLQRARVSKGIRRDAVVDAIVARFSLDPKKKDKVKGYYHLLEVGLLPPEEVNPGALEAIAQAVGARVSDLFGWRRPAMKFDHAVFARAVSDVPLAAPPAPEPPREPEDEIDRLFHIDPK
jgi:hypothetical protein